MKEIEIKLKAPDLKAIENKLIELGATLSAPKTQEDINFVHQDDVAWFETGPRKWAYPRLRIQKDKPLTFTVKKPLENEMSCAEYEIHIDNAEELKGMMELLHYKQGVTVKKTRRTCTLGEYTITLDDVDRLGSFIEIERVVDDGDALGMQEEMFRFAKEHFGLEKDAATMRGYDILMHYLDNK